MVPEKFKNEPAIILGTGPSLANLTSTFGYRVFGVNNTFQDFDLDVWIACNVEWHDIYSPVAGDFDKWHWDSPTCHKYGYSYIPGYWFDGLSRNPNYIHYNHSSGAQALNLAVLYGCDPIYLCGFDMNYNGSARHYFSGLSNRVGEYPESIRKFSKFDGLIKCYEKIAQQPGLPKIYNATAGSAMKCFPFKELQGFL